MMFEKPGDLRRRVGRFQESIQDGGNFRDLGFVFRRLHQLAAFALRLLLNEVVDEADAIALPH